MDTLTNLTVMLISQQIRMHTHTHTHTPGDTPSIDIISVC